MSEKTDKIGWNKIYYKDCMQGMNDLGDKSIDLGITDPPWNVKYGKETEMNFKFDKKNRKKLDPSKMGFLYFDNRENYEEWCHLWFCELTRICKGVVIYCGLKNLKFWINQENYKGIAIHYVSNAKSNGFISYRTCLKPILFFGRFTNRLNNDFFNYWEKWGFLNKKEYIHPCPTNFELWHDLLTKLKPSSVIDPFMGSGTTAEACIKLGIPFLGFEINKAYKKDIDKRLKNCKKEPTQVKLIT